MAGNGGASLSRSMYIFVVRTTVEQDRQLIKEFNALPNRIISTA